MMEVSIQFYIQVYISEMYIDYRKIGEKLIMLRVCHKYLFWHTIKNIKLKKQGCDTTMYAMCLEKNKKYTKCLQK